MVPDVFRYVSRDGVPLLGIGPLELFEQEGSPQLLTRCAVWYGADVWAKWLRRGGPIKCSFGYDKIYGLFSASRCFIV